MVTKKTQILLVCAALAAGCAGPLPPHDDDAVAQPGHVADQPTTGKHGAPDPVQLASTILKPAIADLANRTGAPTGAIVVRRAMPVIWNDGAVGCPEPGLAYTEAVVPGYWVLLEHDSRYYSYHATGDRRFRLCESARLSPDDPPPHGRYNEAV